MPHYVLQLEHERRFGIYSTVVDCLLTPEMSGTEMRRYLETHDYPSWLRPYDPALSAKQYRDITGEAPTAGHKRVWQELSKYLYWNAMNEFAYAKLSDAYVCLPRSAWRNGR